LPFVQWAARELAAETLITLIGSAAVESVIQVLPGPLKSRSVTNHKRSGFDLLFWIFGFFGFGFSGFGRDA
jgi:hypothetical protein